MHLRNLTGFFDSHRSVFISPSCTHVSDQYADDLQLHESVHPITGNLSSRAVYRIRHFLWLRHLWHTTDCGKAKIRRHGFHLVSFSCVWFLHDVQTSASFSQFALMYFGNCVDLSLFWWSSNEIQISESSHWFNKQLLHSFSYFLPSSRHTLDLFIDFVELFRHLLIILNSKRVSWTFFV